MKAATVAAAGRQIEARYIPGRSDGPVLVFLHEGLGSAALWRDVPDAIARRTQCAAIVYSRYGNGFSDVLREPRAVSYMHDEARALPDVLRAFNAEDAILIGHSDGASIALIAASELRSVVRAVVAEAPHVFVEDVSVESIRRAKDLYESGGLRDRLMRHHHDVDRTFYGWNDIWLHPAFREWDIRENLAEIRAPMLLIQGAQDEYGTIAQLDAIRSGAPGSNVDSLYLSRCGHAPHRDRPEIVREAVAAFVENLS